MRIRNLAMSMALIGAVCSVFATNAGTASAEGFQPRLVDANADWYLHFNVEAGRKSDTFKQWFVDSDDGSKNADANEYGTSRSYQLREWIDDRYGIEMDQIDGLTLYPTGQQADAVVTLAFGDIDRAPLLEQTAEKENYRQVEQDGVNVHTWQLAKESDLEWSNEGQPKNFAKQKAATKVSAQTSKSKSGDQKLQFGANQGNASVGSGRSEMITLCVAFAGEVTVFGSDVESVSQAANVVNEKSGLKVATGWDKEALPNTIVLRAAALDLPKAQKTLKNLNLDENAAWQMLAQLKSCSMAIGEASDQHAFFAIQAKMEEKQTARQVSQIMSAFRALAAFGPMEMQEVELGPLFPEVQRQKENIQIGWLIDPAQLDSFLNKGLEII